MLYSRLHPLFAINPSHSLPIHISNVFGAAVGTPSDAGCYTIISGDVDNELECSLLGKHATIQQFISVGAGFLWRALAALFTREGYSSSLSPILDIYLITIYTDATITPNNTCFRGRALTALFLRAAFEMFSISVFCGLNQSHFRLRGSERISGLSQIWNSFSVGTDRGKVRYPEHCRGSRNSVCGSYAAARRFIRSGQFRRRRC